MSHLAYLLMGTSDPSDTSAGHAQPPGMPKASIEGVKMVADVAKTSITLCAALIAFTVTFAHEFHGRGANGSIPFALQLAWLLYPFTILMAIWLLLAATGTLMEYDRGETAIPREQTLRFPAG